MKPTPVPHLLNFPSPEAIAITSVLYKLPEHIEACYCMAVYFALLCILLFSLGQYILEIILCCMFRAKSFLMAL